MCPTAAAAAVIYRGEMQGVHCINIPTLCSGYTRQVCVCEKRTYPPIRSLSMLKHKTSTEICVHHKKDFSTYCGLDKH